VDERSPRSPAFAVTCKPPVMPGRQGWRPATGGLTPIVRAALARRGGAWVSWDGGHSDPPSRLEGLGFDVHSFPLDVAKGFYGGYANRTLWPLFHDLDGRARFEPAWWRSYTVANDAFAAAVTRVAADRPDVPVWVHDYHLCLVPSALRDLGVDNPTVFFLHTPFPAPSLFARLPQRVELLRGFAGADVVGFQTDDDCERFSQAWRAFATAAPPRLVTAPASIDVDSFIAAAHNPRSVRMAMALRRRFFRDRIVLLGVERLDYTKGLPERLRALEVLLARRPDLRRRLIYVQLATPSRDRLPEYQQLRRDVEREIGRINGNHTVPGHEVPIRYLHRALSVQQLAAYYLLADVAIVTPLRDGMNLVAKEFVTVQAAADGAAGLVLSEFAGAAKELTDAVHCNPFDVEGTAQAIEQAIELDEEDRRKRLASMAQAVVGNDVHEWASAQLDGLG